ncbi:MAG: hypothetical protein LBL04_14025 [Bacteroidales bacterium]|nr:hypothetical protein [Bacteroidales bacterium]
MENIKIRLNDVSARFLRMVIEQYLSMPPGNYTALLEHGVLSGLLRRKVSMFAYPKTVCTLTLHPDEAAVIHRIASHLYNDNCDVFVRSMAYMFMAAIGPKTPDRMLQ